MLSFRLICFSASCNRFLLVNLAQDSSIIPQVCKNMLHQISKFIVTQNTDHKDEPQQLPTFTLLVFRLSSN